MKTWPFTKKIVKNNLSVNIKSEKLSSILKRFKCSVLVLNAVFSVHSPVGLEHQASGSRRSAGFECSCGPAVSYLV